MAEPRPPAAGAVARRPNRAVMLFLSALVLWFLLQLLLGTGYGPDPGELLAAVPLLGRGLALTAYISFVSLILGSLWALITDVLRLVHADKHMMVLTPEDFVKQEGNKIIHVPCINIRHVTARGLPPPDRTPPTGSVVDQVSGIGDNAASLVFGRRVVNYIAGRDGGEGNSRRRGRRTPTSLAFIDTRTDREVIITNDKSFGDTFQIAAVIKQYAEAAQQIFMR